jgi:hypothetical protein
VTSRAPEGRRDLIYQEVSDGGVLFDARGEKVYVLNATAAFVWNCLDGRRAAPEIAQELASALGASAPDAARLRKDVDRALDDFRRQKLLAEA